jgi:hypothetical protein
MTFWWLDGENEMHVEIHFKKTLSSKINGLYISFLFCSSCALLRPASKVYLYILPLGTLYSRRKEKIGEKN